MSLKTIDCIEELLKFYDSAIKSDLNVSKNWKRISKSGSDIITRRFENKKTGNLVDVLENSTGIFSIIDIDGSELVNEHYSDFKFVRKFKYATVYSKTNSFYCHSLEKELEDNGTNKFKISDDVKIGVLEAGDTEINVIFVTTADTYFIGYDNNMTTDSVNQFIVTDELLYVPAQEPVDVLSDGFDNLGIKNVDDIKKHSKLYKLDHLLISM